MGRRCPFFWVDATPLPEQTAWLRECSADLSYHLPPWPLYSAENGHARVLVSLLGLCCSPAISKLCDFMSVGLGFLKADKALDLGPGDLWGGVFPPPLGHNVTLIKSLVSGGSNFLV